MVLFDPAARAFELFSRESPYDGRSGMNHSDFLDCLEARRRLPTATEVPILTGLMGVGTPRQNTAGRYAVAHGIGGRPAMDFHRRHSSCRLYHLSLLFG